MRKFQFGRKLQIALTLATALSALPAKAQEARPAPQQESPAPSLEEGFRDPPMTARPRVWWHWMNGNVTKDGITKDLEWMKRVGIGGLQNFDANLSTPQIVEKRLVYMEPDWKDAFLHAGNKAQELGLEMAIAASPGWSETGGPWVPPQDGLKKLVWSETMIDGGKPFNGKIAAPPSQTGPFQNMTKQPGLSEMMGAGELMRPGDQEKGPKFYADVKLLAVPVANGTATVAPSFSLSTGAIENVAALSDGDLRSTALIRKADQAEMPTLLIDYPSEQTIRSAKIFMPGASAMFLGSIVTPALESSADGKVWNKITDLTVMPVQTTVSFPAVTAKHFRITFGPGDFGLKMAPPSPGVVGMGPADMGSRIGSAPLYVAELGLSSEAVINRFEAKAGFEIEKDYYKLGSVNDGASGISPSKIIDITAKMKADGTLDWTPPAGQWKVLRLGYSLLGTTNHPATPEATGLEVDKFDGPAVRRYLEHYLGLYADTLGKPIAQQNMLDAILTDSIEVGAANWTPAMIAKFTELRGYDPTPWLPAITGVIIESREKSDGFLYDYRRTLADLMASEHYGTVAKVAHEHGLKVYGEALENGRPSLGDDLSMRSHADIPMSAMWTHSREDGPNPAHVADMKGAASVANIYGRDYVAAESMTSAMAPWDHMPSFLKRIIDLEFVNGVNRPVIHTSVHQPVDDKVPGLSLFIFGQYFNRHESWAPLARPWIDYLARSSYLLQQGRNVADLAYFYGEDAPPAALYEDALVPDAPAAWAYDFLSPDALVKELTNKEDAMVTKGGAQYRAIYLGGTSQFMTLPVLEKLASLVRGGGTVIGEKPKATPSLADNAEKFSKLADSLWGGDVGKGRVFNSRDAAQALGDMGVAPAFRFTGGSEKTRIPFVERELADGRLFFVSNPGAAAEKIEARFRVTGKAPEIWDAVSGKVSPASYRIEGGETVIPLNLASDDSLFVMFRKTAPATSAAVAEAKQSAASAIRTPWTVSFQEGRRGPAPLTMKSLARWDKSDVPALRYFSGVATYSNSFTAPSKWKSGKALWLDLGEAYDLAEIWVNGKQAGGLWRAPWRIDIGALAKKGANSLEIKIANRWVNRLIGDAQPDAKSETFTPLPTYTADAPLRPSGLVGPVTVSFETK